MKTIYVHGGPGLNPNPEKNLLTETFKTAGFDIEFWHEPKDLSKENTYNELLANLKSYILSFDSKVNVIAHSSGCRALLNVLNEVESQVHSICYLSPALDFVKASDDIIAAALNIFKADNPESFKELEELKAELTPEFNQKREAAIMLAMSSNYFLKNFTSMESFTNYFSFLADENAFNLETFMNARRTMSLNILDEKRTFSTPIITFAGKDDPVFDADHAESIVNEFFENAKTFKMDNMSHYPHIDGTEFFITEYKKFIDGIA